MLGSRYGGSCSMSKRCESKTGHPYSFLVSSASLPPCLPPGDHVIPCYQAYCGVCQFCLHPESNLCISVRKFTGSGVMKSDGKSRITCRGKVGACLPACLPTRLTICPGVGSVWCLREHPCIQGCVDVVFV